MCADPKRKPKTCGELAMDTLLSTATPYRMERAHIMIHVTPLVITRPQPSALQRPREGDNQGRRCMSYLTTQRHPMHTPRHSRCTSQDESIPDREDARVRRVWMWVCASPVSQTALIDDIFR